MLLKDEFEAHSAGSVRDGVRLFDSLNPSVVILDLHLPDQHGLEALRSIRQMDRTAAVIILSGYANLEVVEESKRLGASDCLRKPFNASLLKSRLRELSTEREEGEELAKEQSVGEESAGYSVSNETANDLVSSAFLHDISNPLTSLLALSAMLRDSVEDAAMCGKLSGMIEQNVEFIVSLTEQWRSFSEPESMEPVYAPHGEIARQAFELVLPRAEVKGVSFVMDAAEGTDCPRLNRYACVRVLVNLLQNAIEAAPRDGGKVEFRTHCKGGQVEFSVTDNGCGIPRGDSQEIFLPRYTTKKKGKGLGLFIARRIVESAKGSIAICSRPGKGTTFTVQLPVS